MKMSYLYVIASKQVKFTILLLVVFTCLSSCSKTQQSDHSSIPLPHQFSIGGKTSGLSSSGLILQINGGSDLTIRANGEFTFPNPLNDGDEYTIKVKSQPSVPINQTCAVNPVSGKLAGHPIINVSVTCTTNSYSVGGTVTGLTNKGLVLQLKGEDEIEIYKNGNFLFPNVNLLDGSEFSVAIKKTPHGQSCSIDTRALVLVDGTFNIVAVTCTKKSHRK